MGKQRVSHGQDQAPDQGAAGGSGPSSAREEGRKERVSREDYRSRAPQAFEQVPPHPAQGSHSGHLPVIAPLPVQGSPGGSREGPVRGQKPLPTQSRPVCPSLRSKPPQCLQAEAS